MLEQRSIFMESTISPQRTNVFREVPDWLVDLLNSRGVAYEVICHPRDAIARDTAADTGVKSREFAKTVILDVDGQTIMAVLPANHVVSLEQVAKGLHASRAVLVSKDQLRPLFPDCELGAEPPFGEHYGMPVIMSAAMALDEHITFNAGSHGVAVHMRYGDYRSIVNPKVLGFSVRG
jgi:Ala-tRNA(Pro) deacylase